MAVDHVQLWHDKFLILILWSAQPLRGSKGASLLINFWKGICVAWCPFVNLHFDFTQKINGTSLMSLFFMTQAFDHEPYSAWRIITLEVPVSTVLRTQKPLRKLIYRKFDDSWYNSRVRRAHEASMCSQCSSRLMRFAGVMWSLALIRS